MTYRLNIKGDRIHVRKYEGEADYSAEVTQTGDPFLHEVARRAILSSLLDPGEIRYRQDILRDCLRQPGTVRDIYRVAVEAIEAEKKVWGFIFRDPGSILRRSVQVLELLMGSLTTLRRMADEHVGQFTSPGFTAFFGMLAEALDDQYFETVKEHRHRLKFGHGVLISARLGKGNQGTDYVLRRPHETKPSLRERIAVWERSAYTFRIPYRDEAGARALSELRDRGINLVANALAQSTDHIVSFCQMLRTELGFYLGCLNLHERLAGKGEPVCFPVPAALGRPVLSFQGLYDVCLSLSLRDRVVGNDVNAKGKRLVMITGAIQGGKSTFLRGVGLAQLMMQCGMFVPALSFRSSICDGPFTHYKREEDPTMRSGKLDEELSRMSGVVDHITRNAMVLPP